MWRWKKQSAAARLALARPVALATGEADRVGDLRGWTLDFDQLACLLCHSRVIRDPPSTMAPRP